MEEINIKKEFPLGNIQNISGSVKNIQVEKYLIRNCINNDPEPSNLLKLFTLEEVESEGFDIRDSYKFDNSYESSLDDEKEIGNDDSATDSLSDEVLDEITYTPIKVLSFDKNTRIRNKNNIVLSSEKKKKKTNLIFKSISSDIEPLDTVKNKLNFDNLSNYNVSDDDIEIEDEKPTIFEKFQNKVYSTTMPEVLPTKLENMGYPLTEECIQLIKKLGINVTKNYNRSRYYSLTDYTIPKEMQFFVDLKWGNDKYKSADFEFENLEFSEFDIKDRNTFKFLKDHPDSMLFGLGNVIICSLLTSKDNLNDFDVYILDHDVPNEHEGPFRISEILETLEIE